MKRILFSMVLLMAFGFSFAQQKNVKEARTIANDVKPNFAKAEQLINEALVNPETSSDAATWDVAGLIQKRINEEEMKNAFLQKPYDTMTVYNSILKMFEYFQKCDELAQVPNEKGKIKNKYRRTNAASMIAERGNLINGGIESFNRNDSKSALKYFGTYVESASYPMLNEKANIAATDTLLPQIAYYALLAANNVEDHDAIMKYAPIAVNDKENGSVALQLLAEAQKTKGENDNWVATLQEGIVKFSNNPYFFANLVDYYNTSNQPEKAMDFVNDMLAKSPNDKLYLYVKAYLYHNMKDYDNAIDFYKKTIAVDPEYAEAYSNLALVLLTKAQEVSDAATTNINDANYATDQAKIKKMYEEAMPYYEKVRSLRPDQTDLWAPGLYRIYYNLNMGPQFEEIEKIMQ